MLLVTGLVEGWYDIGPKARAGAAALATCAHLRRAPQVPGHQFTLFAVGMTSACGPRPLRARARPPVADRRARRAAFVPGSYAAFNLRAGGVRSVHAPRKETRRPRAGGARSADGRTTATTRSRAGTTSAPRKACAERGLGSERAHPTRPAEWFNAC